MAAITSEERRAVNDIAVLSGNIPAEKQEFVAMWLEGFAAGMKLGQHLDDDERSAS